MKIFGGEQLSGVEIDAGLAVMVGEFSALDVAGALSAAGVVACIPAMQALIAREAKAGTIKKVTAGIYRQASERNLWNTRNS